MTPYLVHGLGLTRYGLYALAATVTVFLGSFDGGIGATTPRFFAVYAGRGDRRSTTRLLCSLAAFISLAGGVLSTVDWFVSPLLVSGFGVPSDYRAESVFLFRTFGILMTIGLLHGLFVSLLGAHQRFGLTSKATVLSFAGWAFGLFLTVHQHWGLRGIALSLIIEQLVATLMILPASLRYLDRHAVRLAPRSELREFWRFAVRVQGTGLSSLVNFQMDALVIGSILPVRYVGLYNAGANVATQTRLTAGSVLPPMGNHLASVYGEKGCEASLAEMQRLQKVWVVGVSGFTAAALGATYFAVNAWLGPGFRISALVCEILLAGYAVPVLYSVLVAWLTAIGEPGLEARYGVVVIAINVVLTVPLAFVGVLGVVGATAVGWMLGGLYLLRIVRRRLPTLTIPNALRDVPLARSAACLVGTAALETAVGPIIPRGPLGLLACGVPALVGMAAFALSTLGWRRSVLAGRAVAARQPLPEALFR